jgi:DNA-binding response OmpR family regulator
MLVARMKVLIVEDDEKVARFIARVLAEESFVTDLCVSGADAVRQAGAVAYDVILLDWMLPDLDGLAVCRELRRSGNVTPIIMLTARGEVRERILGLETGADDYVVKPFEIDELLARIQAVLRRTHGLGRMQLGDLEIDRLARRVTLAGRALDLTTREYGLLLSLAGQPDRVVARSELLSQVWSTQFDPGSNLVEVHVSRVRDKLGAHAWMIDTVRGKGYRLRQSPP